MMEWVGHAACIREIINAYTILVGILERRDRLGYFGNGEGIILSWVLKELSVRADSCDSG
jgi:hypothetical protein